MLSARERERRFWRDGIPRLADLSEHAVEAGAGCFLRDETGRRLLDLFANAGIVSLGHGDPGFAERLGEAARGVIASPFPHAARDRLWTALEPRLPAGLDRLYLFSSGAEANEAALRLARAATGRNRVVGFASGYHGRTRAVAGFLEGAPRELREDLTLIPFPHRAVDDLSRCEEALRAAVPGAAAVIAEPIQGTAGNVVPPRGFLTLLREVTREAGVPLVVDEVITGGGRTGVWFRSTAEGTTPDILVLGKGLANGFPLAAIVTHDALVARARRAEAGLSFSSSFGGNPLACAAGAFVLDAIARRDLVRHAHRVGETLLASLRAALAHQPLFAFADGEGLMISVGLHDPAGHDGSSLGRLVQTCAFEQDVIVGAAGHRLRINPPLGFGDDEVALTTTALDGALGEAWRRARR